jgi:hypothetical protein
VSEHVPIHGLIVAKRSRIGNRLQLCPH